MKKIHLTSHDETMVREAARIILNNLEKHITIPQLAGMVKFSPKKLKTGFSHTFGKGAYSYLKHRRMEKVKELLLLQQPLKAIAYTIGYKNESALIKAFRLNYGVSPGLWKRQKEHKPA